MSDQPVKFPPEEYFKEQKVTLGEEPIKPRRRPARGKPILGRILFLVLILALIAAGFLAVQKTLMDLEAQAQLNAAQTATQSALAVVEQGQSNSLAETPIVATVATDTLPTATVDPDAIHTATLAVLLTQAAQD